MPNQKIDVKAVRAWMDHCLKMQKALGCISTSAYKQFPGYNGLAAAAKELHYIHREPVQQKDKSYRVSSVWKLEPFDDKHAERLLKHYRERANRIAAERYRKENPEQPPVEPETQPEPPTTRYTQQEVDQMVQDALRKYTEQFNLPIGGPAMWPPGWSAPLGVLSDNQTKEPEVPTVEEQLLNEARQTNSLLIRLLKCWSPHG